MAASQGKTPRAAWGEISGGVYVSVWV